jgi:hypothetical protein
VQVRAGADGPLAALGRVEPRHGDVLAASSPAESRHAANSVVSRITWLSIRASAARCPTAWNIAIGCPNCCRVFEHSAVSRTASSVIPMRNSHTAVLVASMIHAKAAPSSLPSTADPSTRTPSTVTSASAV